MKLTNCPLNSPSKKQKELWLSKSYELRLIKSSCFACSFPIGLDVLIKWNNQ